MTTGLKIKAVAEASGFSAATLRYYEQIGLLPETSRTAAGYRMYDQRTLDRLAFIARAKQLGCTLEEITGLTAAWDGGQCGPIQDQLRQLVAGKITATKTTSRSWSRSRRNCSRRPQRSNDTDPTAPATRTAAV